jgi:protoporphyrinogen oxidase
MKVEKIVVDNVIIGGGVTALLLAAQFEGALIITAGPMGGLIASTVKDGFSFDYGGHVYTNADKNVVDLMKAIPSTYHPERKAYFDVEKLVPFPVQDNAHMLGLEVAGEPSTLNNFYDYSKHILGTNFTDGFMRPFNERVWTTKMKAMDFDWTEGRVKAPTELKEKWGMNSDFWYAKGSDITSKLMRDAIEHGALVANGFVTDVNQSAHILTVYSSDGQFTSIKYSQLFDTAGLFLTLRRNKVLTIGVGLNHMLDRDFDWIYPKFGENQPVHRVTLLSRYGDDMTPTLKEDSLLLEIPHMSFGSLDPLSREIVFSKSDKQSATLVKQLLLNAGFTDAERYDIATVWRAKTSGYPIPTIGHRHTVGEAKFKLLSRDIFLCGRWGSHGYFNLQHIYQDVQATMQAESGSYFSNYLHSNFYYKDGTK